MRFIPYILLVEGVWLCFVQPAARAQDSPPIKEEKYSLRGTVVNTLTGQPIRRALVELYSRYGRQTMTDQDGHFELDNLPAIEAPITARKPGFLTEQELSDEPNPLPSIRVGPDTPAVTLRLFPEGVIAGRIENQQGEPIETLPVDAIWVRVFNGSKQWNRAGNTRTDEDGRFRIPHLKPGLYYLSAGPSWQTKWGGTAGSKGQDLGYNRVFYPGVPDLASASPINLAVGEDAEASFSIAEEPMYQVSGVISGLARGEMANLQFVSPAGDVLSFPTRFGPGLGEFAARVPRGSYSLRANLYRQSDSLVAAQPLGVQSHLSGIHLVLGPGLLIPVEIRLEPARDKAQPSGASEVHSDQLNIHLSQRGLQGLESWQMVGGASQAAQHALALEPGQYSVEIRPVNPGWYIESARCGDTDVLRDELPVSAGSRMPPLEVVLRNDAANLHGTVIAEGKATRGAVLVVDDRARAHPEIAYSGEDGQFMFNGLRPGQYSVIALDHVSGFEYLNPEVLGPYLSNASRVTLERNGENEIQVSLTRVDK